ncbi:MAG: hypothetical protein JNM31_02120 [Flavobacteriales bacterium]|nr:hypothetical protein [Flavobacteriales bacterium]
MTFPTDPIPHLRDHYSTGATRPYAVRSNALRRFYQSLRKHEEEHLIAMRADMRKPRFAAYMSDVDLVYAAIEHALLPPAGAAFIVSFISQRGTGDRIAAFLASRGLLEGEDFILAA